MKKKCVAMLLAGGQGSRLKALTKNIAKPAVPFGGKYRIIDFPLSNCLNSGIDTVGVVTQYQPLLLHSYIGNGGAWDLDKSNGGVVVLPPYSESSGMKWYTGTASAIYENMHFIEQYDPDHVLILSGDHIYKMDYGSMLDFHIEKDADVSISVLEVPWEETSRFGIMNADEDLEITEFEEKPENAKSNLASMGIYIFKREVLQKYLELDHQLAESSNDFGKDIIPALLEDKKKLMAYPFKGYWKDVGTVNSLWEANMDLLKEADEGNKEDALNLFEKEWRIYSKNNCYSPQYMAPEAVVEGSLVNDGCVIEGTVQNSVISQEVHVQENSNITDSVIMSNAVIGKNVKIHRAVVGPGMIVPDNSIIEPEQDSQEILLYMN